MLLRAISPLPPFLILLLRNIKITYMAHITFLLDSSGLDYLKENKQKLCGSDRY